MNRRTHESLSAEELRRYQRHLILPEFGMEGQMRLKQASILLVGAGGLGSPIALYLAAAGVGHIGLVDDDVVDEGNLQRQILHSTAFVGKSKTQSAIARINELNPNVTVTAYEQRLSSENAKQLLSNFDIIIDGSDNFPTRYLVNDAAVLLGRPVVYGAIYRFEGQLSVFNYGDGPCYRCLYPEAPAPDAVPSCEDAGVLGVLPGVIGTLQANEAIKLAAGIGTPLAGQLLLYNALGLSFRKIKLKRDDDCAVCGENPTITELIDYDFFCGIKTTENRNKENDMDYEITPQELKARLDKGDTDFVLLDVREQYETEIVNLENSTLIPMGEIAARMDELDEEKEYVVYCRSGARSGQIVDYLRAQGFDNAKNLVGGINQWATEIDTSLSPY